MTPEQIYKKNQLKSKIFNKVSPIVYWGFIGLFVLFIILAIANSWGNIREVIGLLDKEVYNGNQISENYAFLIEKYGEWEIVGKDSNTFSIRFIDIRKAFFSGLMITYIVLAIVCLVIAIILGKVLFPKLAKLYTENNQDMVNLATLQTNAEIQKRNKKSKEEGWF